MATYATATPSRSPFASPADHYDHYGQQEDLASEHGFSDMEDDMGELSDSPSSYVSSSRPTTPSGHPGASCVRTRQTTPPSNEPFSIAHKAERILGLTPGTLPHARAALENARDEVRRTADLGMLMPTVPVPTSAGASGMRNRLDRAKKAMSVALPVGTKVPGLVFGVGGKDEEEKRERRRRAADGVLYWQKEVARLQEEEANQMMTVKKGRR